MSDLLTQIKQKRDERVQDLHLDLPLPTWDGDMYVRFRILDRADVEKFSNQKRSSETDGNFIVKAASEIYIKDSEGLITDGVRHEENPEYVRLDDETGTPIVFDQRLAEKLGEEQITTARGILMFCLKDNAIALGGLTLQVITWMQNTDNKVGSSIAGES